MPQTGDIAVVGAGIVGLATAHALKEAGESVVVYERGRPGGGQSAAESRLFRHAHDDRRLAELTRESRAVWREWEERFGTELISRDGVVALGDDAIEKLRILDELGGVDAREIEPDEVAERLPILAEQPRPAVFDADGGAIRTSAAIEALSAELGDAIRPGELISARATGPETVEVRTESERAEHSRLVVCAGRGAPALARTVGLSLPVTHGAHVRVTFALAGEPPERLACLQDSSGAFPETGVYAAPLPGNGAFAVGLSETTDAKEDGTLPDPGELEGLGERTVAYVERALPGLEPRPIGHLHCFVTELPWSEDAFAVWEAGPILFVAGHNLFKQAPGLGRLVARAARGEGLDERLRPGARLG